MIEGLLNVSCGASEVHFVIQNKPRYCGRYCEGDADCRTSFLPNVTFHDHGSNYKGKNRRYIAYVRMLGYSQRHLNV